MKLCTFFRHAGINMIVATRFLWTSDVRTVAVHCITLYSSNRLFAYGNEVQEQWFPSLL